MLFNSELLTNPKQIVAKELGREILAGEKLRTLILAAAFGAFFLLSITLPLFFPPEIRDDLARLVPPYSAICLLGLVMEFAFWFFLNYFTKRDRYPPEWARHIGAILETSLPTLILVLEAQRDASLKDALTSLGPFGYLFLIMLGIAQLSFSLSAVRGITASLEYLIVSILFTSIIQNGNIQLVAAELPANISKSIIFLIAGVAAGFVALQLRRRLINSALVIAERNRDLAHAYDKTMEGWSRALDLRDKETEGHTLRVTEMTIQLARAFGMSEAEIVHVRRGALLHDMGKLGIPDSILLKPGKLTDEERNTMRQHPRYAYEMLAPIEYLRPALDIPYCHHEKWDGTGYPRQLQGEAIPLSARLFALADVYDALTSDRPYHAAWTKDKTLEHIKTLSGSHFEPRAVEVFLQTRFFR
ncbi:MAG: HD domain-containing protein [Chloroflexi bacterium]|nr:HD domain-containing protein [Chloroflexota bacterium]